MCFSKMFGSCTDTEVTAYKDLQKKAVFFTKEEKTVEIRCVFPNAMFQLRPGAGFQGHCCNWALPLAVLKLKLIFVSCTCSELQLGITACGIETEVYLYMKTV